MVSMGLLPGLDNGCEDVILHDAVALHDDIIHVEWKSIVKGRRKPL